METGTTYTIQIVPIDGRLQVSIQEIGVTFEMGSTRRDEAIDAAHRAIIDYLRNTREMSQAKAS